MYECVRRNFGGRVRTPIPLGWTRTEDRASLVHGSSSTVWDGSETERSTNRSRGEDGEEGDDERSAEAFRIPARSELGVGELMVVPLCYSGGAPFSLHLLLCTVIVSVTGSQAKVTRL